METNLQISCLITSSLCFHGLHKHLEISLVLNLHHSQGVKFWKSSFHENHRLKCSQAVSVVIILTAFLYWTWAISGSSKFPLNLFGCFIGSRQYALFHFQCLL